MKKTAISINCKTFKVLLSFVLAAFLGLSPVYAQRNPIDINLIIDGSESLTGVKDKVTTWVSDRFDQIVVQGDRVTVWNAASASRVIFSNSINSAEERESIIRNIREISPSGNNADFSGALREAGAAQQQSSFSYTLLISASPTALSSVLSGPHANLLRFSRVEEFSDWRVLVVGLNIDTRVRRAAAAFLNTQ